jgi:hypothetical protein
MLSCHLPREAADTTESFRISGPRAYIWTKSLPNIKQGLLKFGPSSKTIRTYRISLRIMD